MYGLLLIIALIVIIVLSVAVYQKSTNAICLSRRRLDGKTVIVTGGTAGMGLHIATDLAHRGARVIVASSSEDEGTSARKQIEKETGNENVVYKNLDLASLKSVRQFAADILKTEERLDVLLNNAGVLLPDKLTADGMNYIMQVNYYGAFLLTLLLLPLLKKTGKHGEPSRIVTTSSCIHVIGQVDLASINKTRYYWFKFQPYANSKICPVLFAHELTKRLRGSHVVINNVDPGAVGTRLFDSANVVLGSIVTASCKILFKTPWQGAQTALHVALDTKAGEVSGEYFKNCEIGWAVGRARCDKTASALWEDSIRLVKLTNEEVASALDPFN